MALSPKNSNKDFERPAILPSQPLIKSKTKKNHWLSWLGIFASIIFIGLSFVPGIQAFGFIGQAALGALDAATQVGIAAAQGPISPLEVALNFGIGVLPAARLFRNSTRAEQNVLRIERSAARDGKALNGFKLNKGRAGSSSTIEYGGSTIDIDNNSANRISNLIELSTKKQVGQSVTYTGGNFKTLLKQGLRGSLSGRALGSTTTTQLVRTTKEQVRTMDSFIFKEISKYGYTDLKDISRLSRTKLASLSKNIQKQTGLNRLQVGTYFRRLLPSNKLNGVLKAMNGKLTPYERLQRSFETKLAKLKTRRLSKGAIDIRTGKINRINTRAYYSSIQIIHFLDPKLAARKILTKAQHYAHVALKKWFMRTEREAVVSARNKFVRLSEKFAKTRIGKFMRRVGMDRSGILLREIEEEMHYFPESVPMRGIRVVPMLGTGNSLAHVIAFFKPGPTNNKAPVVLSNVPMTQVAEWIQAPSKMGYYLDNFAFTRGGKPIGFSVTGPMGALLGFMPLSLLRAHLSLASNMKKLGKLIASGKYGTEWKDIWKTFERLGPHKLGKFVFGRYGIALVRGFQKTSKGRTRFSFNNKFSFKPLEESISRKVTSTGRKYQTEYNRMSLRERRLIENWNRVPSIIVGREKRSRDNSRGNRGSR